MKVDSNPRYDKKLAAKYAEADRRRNKARRRPAAGPPRSERPLDPGLRYAYSMIKEVGPGGSRPFNPLTGKSTADSEPSV